MLAEHAVDRLVPWLQCTRGGWTRDAVLPGGDLDAAPAAGSGQGRLAAFVEALNVQYGWMPPRVLRRMAGAYGTRVHAVLGSAQRLADLGEPIAEGLYEAELDYLVAREWAASAEDVLWRRSKLGLHLLPAQRRRVQDWFERRR